MTTLHLYAEAAIRRDLARARTLLASRIRMTAERRQDVTEHLTWMASLVLGGTDEISPAAAAVRDAALAYGAEGLTEDRVALVRAIDGLVVATAARRGAHWTADDVPRVACGNLPWVLDEVPLRGGPVLVLPSPPDAETARARAAEYRRRRAKLWGPVALVPTQAWGAVATG
ncbi:MAG: hypothetical protein ACJ72E_03095 [Marmoricola sp.]